MSHEISYMHLKAANEARLSEEQRSEKRKKNTLLLILQHLREEGYLDTANALETECGYSLQKFEVCDNISLPTIIQEYEIYYYSKFNKWPKISKPTRDTGYDMINSKHSQRMHQYADPFALPKIERGSGRNRVKQNKRPSSDTRKKESKSNANQASAKSADVRRPTQSPQSSESSVDLEIKSTQIQQKPSEQKSVAKSLPNKEKLLKPVAGFAGFTGEWRDLAEVISKDIYLENTNVKWDDIIGLEEAKRLVKEAVVYPIKYPELFTGILSPWKGLLLYGPPGTGKTLLAKAVATECNTTFFNISASSIVSKWRGDSEKLVRVLFELARFHAPSTIFLDELDSLMSQRGSTGGGSGEHEGSRRMKTELLVQMDGLARSDELVFLLAASNLPWELDHAMLRRLEKRIMVDLPSREARKSMLEHYLPSEISSKDSRIKMTADIDYAAIAEATAGYSGSDVYLVCKEAAMRPVRNIFSVLESHEKGISDDLPTSFSIATVTTDDIHQALKRTKPSSAKLQSRYEAWQKEYESV
eukprot:gene9467-10454_t